MRKIIILLILSILFIGCLPIMRTTYQVKNACDFTLEEVVSYYWDGENLYDFVQHGDMYSGDVSNKVETERNEISLGLEIYGDPYIVVNPYPIQSNTNNLCEINGDTVVYGKGKSNITFILKDILD
jgi:hypothetical protein